MSKEVNTNRAYYRPGKNMYSSDGFSDGSKSRSDTRDDLWGSANLSFSKDDRRRDTRQLNYATTNYVMDSYDSTRCDNTREARHAPIETFKPYPNSSCNMSGDTNVLGKRHYNYGISNGIQGPVSTSKVLRSTYYADSFVTYNINNRDPMPNFQQQKMERDTVSDFVNPMPLQNYTQKSVPDSHIYSGQSMWQNNERNTALKVIPAFERKGRPQNPDDPSFVLFPKEPTFDVKIIKGVRIAPHVIKISYRKSLKSTAVYTIGRKGGTCKKALAKSKRKRALWWITQGKTIEEAILLCLRPYHEIYEEILERKHSWGTPMMIRNLKEQINKEGAYNSFIGRPQDSETSDDSADEPTEQLIKPEDESKEGDLSKKNELDMNVQLNYGQKSNNLMTSSLPTQDNIQKIPTQQETENGSSQKGSYDPKSHLLSSLADRNRPFPVNSEPASDLNHTKTDNYSPSSLVDGDRSLPVNSEPVDTGSIKSDDLIHIKTVNYSLSSLADRERLPINCKPVSKLLYTNRDNPYTKVNTKTKTINLKQDIRGAALRRYYYWLNVGKTPEVAKALCVLKMNQIPLYQQIKGTMGTLKNFVKRSQNKVNIGGTLSVADTGPASIVDKAGYCDNINDFTENVYEENPQEESAAFIPENTEGSAHGLENPNTSKSHVKSYANEIEQYIKSLNYRGKTYKKIFNPAAINKYRWWRHVGRTVKEARKMCLYPFHRYRKEHEEGVKIIDFKTYILEDAVNPNIAEETAKCPTEFKGHKKLRYNYWIKLGKTSKEAIDLTLQGFMWERRNKHYVERVKKRQKYLSTLQSSGRTYPSHTQSSQNKNNSGSSSVFIIPTIGKELSKDTDENDAAHIAEIKSNIHTYNKRTENNAKKQVEPATQLTNADLIQGKSEEEARDLCHKSMVVSEFLNGVQSYKKERVVAKTYEGSKLNIADLSQNLRREEISDKQIFGKNAIKTDAIANIVAQEAHNLPMTQNLVVPSNVKAPEQGEFRVCIKANKVNLDLDDFAAIKNSLNLCVADEDGIKIKSFNRRRNLVIITCLNEQTRDWLDKQIPTLVPWENGKLEIIDEDEVPVDILAHFFVAFDTQVECSTVTPEQFMQQLDEQNPDVGCDRWIVQKVEMKTDPTIGFYVIGLIDKKSKDVLTSKYNKLKWFDKRNIKVNFSSTKKKKSKAESAARAVLFVPKVPECRLHSSQQYLLNRLHKLNPTVGCDGWKIVQKRIKPDGAALLVRLNNASKHKVENIKKLHWYRSQTIVITIVPIYVDINLPIDDESKYLRLIPQTQIAKTLTNKLHYFNPSFGCLNWVVIQLQDKVDEWHLTFKINEHECHQKLIKTDYKLYWYGGRWLEIKLGKVPELEMFESKKDTNHSIKPATSYQSKDNVTKINVNEIASGSLLSPQLTFSEETKVQDSSNCKLPSSMLWNNPENCPDIAMLSSSRQDRTAVVSYTEREPYNYERDNRFGFDCNETHHISPALKYALPEIPEYARPLDGHGRTNLGLVKFGEKEDVARERYSDGIRRCDADRDTCSEDRYRLESNRDAYYSNTERINIENVDYNNDDCYQNTNENRLENERGHTPYPNADNLVNHDPRSNDEYMNQDMGYNFDQHRHDRVDTRDIYYVREKRKFDGGESLFDREERNIDRESRYFDREEDNHNREEKNFNTEERLFDREERNIDREGRHFNREGNYHNREEKNFNTEERLFDREERNIGRGGRHFDREEDRHNREGISFEKGHRYFDTEKSPQDGARLEFENRSSQETEYFQRQWLPDHQDINKYVEKRKRRYSRDQRGQKWPHLRPERRETLHESRESLNQNKLARASGDRRHDALIDRFKRLADYNNRQHHYHESSSYSNRERQNSRPSFDEPPSKPRRQRR